jgi:outer membrane protein
MKKNRLVFSFLFCWHLSANAANLLEVYQQAQKSDPTFYQAVAERLSTKEGVPISVASLLPNIAVTASPYVSRTGYSGSNFDPVTDNSGAYLNPRNLTQRGYALNLTLTQTIFDFAQFASVKQQAALSKGADATLNSALQDLMIRTSAAYFAILQDEDNISYAKASKTAYASQLNQIRQQYKVGLKTITDVYTAQASYDSAEAAYIAATTTLATDKENLRAITGKYYDHLSPLSEKFPLSTPKPNDINQWEKIALAQNWSIKAAQYNVHANRAVIYQQAAGHLPTVNLQTTFSRQYSDNINSYASFSERNGPGTTSDRALAFNINIPIFSGGGVVAQTKQAVYNYQTTQQQLEAIIRSTIATTRQSYLSILAGTSQITADRQAIKSATSSLNGMQASYEAGTAILVDVLDQQQKVYEAQTQYAKDRYAFINNILLLKQAAGTLSIEDLRTINTWLG